jgi:hypothetical protein
MPLISRTRSSTPTGRHRRGAQLGQQVPAAVGVVQAATPGSPSRLAITARVWLPSTTTPIQARIWSGSASGRSRTR